MEVTEEERRHLEEVLAELESLDPADLPGPAARLADLLSRLLDPSEASP
ncbi:MAG TPA: hypothetical protein VJ938_02165 [Acidimicrobiia bacterium]|jgi:hypothetical protein|nr:hypothetical protein [Acidimicrobiia bacterium]